MQIRRDSRDGELIIFDLREIQKVVDELQEPLCVRVHALEIPALELRDLTKVSTQHRLERS